MASAFSTSGSWWLGRFRRSDRRGRRRDRRNGGDRHNWPLSSRCAAARAQVASGAFSGCDSPVTGGAGGGGACGACASASTRISAVAANKATGTSSTAASTRPRLPAKAWRKRFSFSNLSTRWVRLPVRAMATPIWMVLGGSARHGREFKQDLGVGNRARRLFKAGAIADCFAEVREFAFQPPAQRTEPEQGRVEAGHRLQVEVALADMRPFVGKNNAQLLGIPVHIVAGSRTPEPTVTGDKTRALLRTLSPAAMFLAASVHTGSASCQTDHEAPIP